MLLSAARTIFDKNIVDKRDPAWVPLTTSVRADTTDSRLENLLERPAMPAYARFHIVPPDKVGVYHCMARCVRRAFLCGVDPLTNHDYDSRKESDQDTHLRRSESVRVFQQNTPICRCLCVQTLRRQGLAVI
jgi:hypothetical protein